MSDCRNEIPGSMLARFNTVAGRRELVQRYGNSVFPYCGWNADGEFIKVQFNKERGIVLVTDQNNGWTSVRYYDADGYFTGETFDGRWVEKREVQR